MNSDQTVSIDRREKLDFLSHFSFCSCFLQKNELFGIKKTDFFYIKFSLTDLAHIAPRVHDLSGSVSAPKLFISSWFKFNLF